MGGGEPALLQERTLKDGGRRTSHERNVHKPTKINKVNLWSCFDETFLTSTVHFAIENSNNLEVTEAQLRCNASGVTLSQKDI